MDLLVAVSPFVLMGLVLLGLWWLLRRGGSPVGSSRWGIAAAVAAVLIVLWLVLGPDEMSTTERLLTVLPVAAFIVLALPTIKLLRRVRRRQR